jgi:hypothetical protein
MIIDEKAGIVLEIAPIVLRLALPKNAESALARITWPRIVGTRRSALAETVSSSLVEQYMCTTDEVLGGSEDHLAKEYVSPDFYRMHRLLTCRRCDQPRNPATIQCRNCDQ